MGARAGTMARTDYATAGETITGRVAHSNQGRVLTPGGRPSCSTPGALAAHVAPWSWVTRDGCTADVAPSVVRVDCPP